MKKTDVYWAWNSESDLALLAGDEPERLTTCIKNERLFKNTGYGKILECPAFVEHVRNTYVMKAPYDMTIFKGPEGAGYRVGWAKFEEQRLIKAIHTNDDYIQAHEIYSWMLFSDTTVNVTVTPPFMHLDTLPSAPASYDISKWYRPIGPAYMLEGKDEHIIKAGKPILYVSFDRAVNFKKYVFNDTLMRYSQSNVGLKFVKPKLSLNRLYTYFVNNKLNKAVSREIKRNLL